VLISNAALLISLEELNALFARYPQLAPLFGSLAGSILTLTGAFLVANRYTKGLKRTDATLEFSKRYHELVLEAGEINKNYSDRKHEAYLLMDPGVRWWVRFFDLMLFQYHFYRHGLVMKDTFVEWMWWRRFDWTDERPRKKVVAGMTYSEGWTYYRDLPAHADSPLTPFLESIHRAKNINTVRRIVVWHKFPSSFRRVGKWITRRWIDRRDA
jgi:hypothetical protein